MADQQTTPNEFEQLRATAEAVIARKLNAQTIGGEAKSQFLDSKITLDTGLKEDKNGDTKQHYEVIRLTIESPQLEQFPNDVRKAMENVLQNIAPIDEFVRARSAEEEIHYVKSKLATLQKAGAEVPETIFKWAGFDEKNDERHEVDDHLINTTPDDYGVLVSVNLPRHLPSGMTSETVSENIKERLDDIKELLAKRILKAQGSKAGNAEEVREQVNTLEFKINHGGESTDGTDVTSGSVSILIQSPAQKEAFAAIDLKDLHTHTSHPELRETNALQSLDPLALNKAVSHALQKANPEKAAEVIPVILGTRDVFSKLEKILEPFKKKHPEYAHQVADVMNSNVFAEQSWYKKNDSQHFTKEPVIYNKEADGEHRGKMTVQLVVPEGKAAEIIEKVAAMDKTLNPVAQRFASVDEVQIIGAFSADPAIHAKLQEMVAPHIGVRYKAGDNLDHIKPFAEKLVGLVSKMHQAKTQASTADTREDIKSSLQTLLDTVDEAHEALVGGVKAGAQHAQQQEREAVKQPPEQSLATTVSTEKLTPHPIMTPEWITRLVHLTNDKGASFMQGA